MTLVCMPPICRHAAPPRRALRHALRCRYGRPGRVLRRIARHAWLVLRAKVRCALCRRGVPHHTNSATSIGGVDRHPIRDIHAVRDTGGVGLAHCTADTIWFRIEPR